MSSAAQKEPPVLASLAAWPAGATQPVCDAPAFRGIHISESHCFPPQPGPLCWVYVTLNAEIARNRSHDAGLRSILEGQRARTSVDSQWIWWALQRRYGARAPRKMSGSDLIHTLAQHCAAQGRSLLLLGSAQHANDDAVHALRRACPGLHVTGFAPRAYVAGGSDEAAAWGESLAVALATAADFVVIGLSPDKQYRLAAHLAPHLDGMTQGLLCFGGAIDMASGRVKRAPLLWQRMGVESIYRILQQPSRLPRLLRLLPIVPQVLLGRY